MAASPQNPLAPPILITQHMPEHFTKTWADRMNSLCRISVKEADRRETRYQAKGRIWCFTLNRRWVRDAAFGGNWARFINHTCTPNC